VEAEEERAAADAEYAKLKPPPPPKPTLPFDPVELAKRRIKAEEERAAVDREYAKLNPKSMIDSVLELVESLRGTIGGTLGSVAGAVLDITAKIREMRAKKSSMEAGSSTAPMATPVPSAIPVTPQTAGNIPTAADFEKGGAYNPPPTATVVPQESVPAAVQVEELGGAAEITSESLAAAVPVIGAVVAGAVVLVGAFKSVAGAANEMADKYSEYNPAIAQQQAMADIRAVMGDMRRAQQSSRELTEFIRAQSELQQRYEDIKVALLTRLIPIVTGVMEILGSLLGIASSSDVFKEVEDPTTAITGRRMGGLGSAEMIPEL
jgi:hypothetical protein